MFPHDFASRHLHLNLLPSLHQRFPLFDRRGGAQRVPALDKRKSLSSDRLIGGGFRVQNGILRARFPKRA
jgi:hypothetical protein